MKLIPIKAKDFETFYNHLEEDFIFEERRTKQKYLTVLKNKHFKPNFIYDKQLKQIVGYFCYWEFDDFIFGEHFAIYDNLRNQGLGSKFLNHFLTKIKKTFIGEIEQPATQTAKRRCDFYVNKGFQILKKDYFQPSYHNSNKQIPMYIIGYDKSENFNFNSKLDKMIEVVYKNVYNLNV